MDMLRLDDKRIPDSFRDRVVVDDRTGCWIWCGKTMPNGLPSYRRKSALNWLWELGATPRDSRPSKPIHRIRTTCGRWNCMNLYHRLLETAEPRTAVPHRCPSCGHWCQASLGTAADAAQ